MLYKFAWPSAYFSSFYGKLCITKREYRRSVCGLVSRLKGSLLINIANLFLFNASHLITFLLFDNCCFQTNHTQPKNFLKLIFLQANRFGTNAQIQLGNGYQRCLSTVYFDVIMITSNLLNEGNQVSTGSKWQTSVSTYDFDRLTLFFPDLQVNNKYSICTRSLVTVTEDSLQQFRPSISIIKRKLFQNKTGKIK